MRPGSAEVVSLGKSTLLWPSIILKLPEITNPPPPSGGQIRWYFVLVAEERACRDVLVELPAARHRATYRSGLVQRCRAHLEPHEGLCALLPLLVVVWQGTPAHLLVHNWLVRTAADVETVDTPLRNNLCLARSTVLDSGRVPFLYSLGELGTSCNESGMERRSLYEIWPCLYRSCARLAL